MGRRLVDLCTAGLRYNLFGFRMGHASQVSGNLVAGEPLVYALEDSPAARPVIRPATGEKANPKLAAGSAAKFSIRLSPSPMAHTPSGTAHVEVRNPKGQIAEYYDANVPLGNSAIEFTIPLALNDPPGTWHVSVTEPFAHQTATADFELEGRVKR